MRARLVDVPPVVDTGFDCGYPAFNDLLARLRPVLSTKFSAPVAMRTLVSPGGSRTIGYVVFSRRTTQLADERHETLWIERVAVDLDFQRLGLASRILIPAAADAARAAEIEIVACQGATDGGRTLFDSLKPIATDGVGKRAQYFFRTSALPLLSLDSRVFDLPSADLPGRNAPIPPGDNRVSVELTDTLDAGTPTEPSPVSEAGDL